MDFFQHQDQARSSTRKLVVLFALAVLSLIIFTTLLIYGLFFYAENSADIGFNADILFSEIFLKVALGVCAVVALGSLFRLAQLRGGGQVVAESLGGRLINSSTRDADERKVLNIVEEMAIASGLPVPPVYILDDSAINAFAAGYQQQDAVIGVTRGCIQQLDRDELQGVIAHEFSHITHGDMRLNIRLMGVLYGILVLGLIGYFLMRGSMYSGRRSRNNGIIFLGLGLVIIGYGGTFFGNLIKAAVSRQREFLADASAVQFTRNPDGIAGALKKIGGYSAGSQIKSVDVSEISHMLFEEGVKAGFGGMLATHPSLEERIRRIHPTWQGGKKGRARDSVGGQPTGVAGFAGGQTAADLMDTIGNPGPAHIAQAVQQLAAIPELLRQEAHEPFGARALMHALVISSNESGASDEQVAYLRQELNAQEFREFEAIHAQVRQLPRNLMLPVLELAMPSLKQLSRDQYRSFMSRLTKVITLDRQISLFEWCLFKILRHNLDDGPASRSGSLELVNAVPECEVLLSVLAAAGETDEDACARAFAQAAKELDVGELAPQDMGSGDVKALDAAVDRLRDLKPLQKPRLLKAMVKCIMADGKVTPVEGELLRAVASLLDCPMPPLLDENNQNT